MRLLNRQAFLSTVNSAAELPKDKTAWAPEEQSLLGQPPRSGYSEWRRENDGGRDRP